MESKITFEKVACGGHHFLATTKQGDVYTWGWGLYGMLGHGDSADQSEPKLVEALIGEPVMEIAAGPWHSCCVTAGGDVYTFGWGEHGRLGHGNATSSLEPKLVEALEEEEAVKVACGSRHTAIVTRSGSCYSMGWNKYGQVGDGSRTDQYFPVDVTPKDMRARDVACGRWHTLLV
mmetsp:Transcript_43129/g.70021  ORF Transcript_43129/g.70021 Transcript_43129/m.70021 type:complete len:176 (+) Transcript_43129:513-1040(+)